MGKQLIQQRRGKGSSRFRAPSFRYAGKVGLARMETNKTINGKIIDIIRSLDLGFASVPVVLVVISFGLRIGLNHVKTYLYKPTKSSVFKTCSAVGLSSAC